MNRIIVAVTHELTNNVTILPPSVTVENNTALVFHNSPHIEYTRDGLVANFDYHVDFSVKPDTLNATANGKYFHFPRIKKTDQYLKIHNFNVTRDVSKRLQLPLLVKASTSARRVLPVVHFGIPPEGKLVVKQDMGARGSNQIVMPSNMLVTFLKHTKGLTINEIKNQFPDFTYTDNSDWDEVLWNSNEDIIVTELITGVAQEFRLLISGDKIYGRERTIKPGPYPQANLEVGLWHSIPEVRYTKIEDMFDVDLVETLHDLVKHINIPLGSIDLYKTEEGDYGIFEYSTQFAFHGANPQFIRDLHVNAIRHVLGV